MMHFEIPHQKLDMIKFQMREMIASGISEREAVNYGVKSLEKIINKRIGKHKKLMLHHIETTLIKAFIVDKEYMNDPMTLLNQSSGGTSENIHRTDETR